MTRIKVKLIIFDDYNLGHIAKHKVTKKEVTEAGKNLLYHRRTYKDRYLVIGLSKKRLITLIVKKIDKTKYYLVTARDSSRVERIKVNEKDSKK